MAVINLLNLIVCVIFFNPILSRQIQKLAFKQKLKYLEGIHCPFKKKNKHQKTPHQNSCYVYTVCY